MSSYSDTFNINTVEKDDQYKLLDERIRKKLFSQMKTKTFNYLINRNKQMILIICLLLIILYSCLVIVSVCMMTNVQSELKLIHQDLKIEQNQLNQLKKRIKSMKKDVFNSCQNRNRKSSDVCYLILHWRFDGMISRILENNQHMKKSSDDLLFPLQYFFILFSFVNIIFIKFIFKQPFRLFIISCLFVIIISCMHSEYFLSNHPYVYYTFILGVFLILFSIWILLQIIQILLAIVHYRTIKELFINQ